jgi:hypothetical protein
VHQLNRYLIMTFESTRMNSSFSLGLVTAAVAGLLGLSACGSTQADATAENFTAAMNTYLAQRGDLCVGKANWPIDVTEREIRAGARNAVQLPVLEKLGLAGMSVAEIDKKDEDGQSHHMKVRRYELTEAGTKYYLARGTAQSAADKPVPHDLCGAKLSLEKVVRWTAPALPQASVAGAAPLAADKQMVVTYTYKAEPAEWMKDPDAQKVFPVVANVVRGAGTAELTETFRQTEAGWVAIDM